MVVLPHPEGAENRIKIPLVFAGALFDILKLLADFFKFPLDEYH